MPVRMKHKTEINHIAFLVIGILGVVAVISTWKSGQLIDKAVTSENEVDSAAVALIGQMVSIATLTIGGLIAMLTSTGPKPAQPPSVPAGAGMPESIPVTVVNPPADPVPTDPVVPPEPEPDLPAEDGEVPADVGGDGEALAEPEPVRRTRSRRSE